MTATAASFQIENGATVTVPKDCAVDYSLMRANQLAALLSVMQTSDFDRCAAGIKADCLSLAQTISSEIAPLIQLVASQSKPA